MMRTAYKRSLQELLVKADIRILGTRSWDMQVHDERVYERVIRKGSVGLGEAYMDGWWDAMALDQFFYKVMRFGLERSSALTLKVAVQHLGALLTNRQDIDRASASVIHHYDLGNDLYSAMLDKRMIYSCAYWENADDLDMAQENKLDMVCRKMGLQPGQRILDIGCGWGGLAKYAAQKCGVHVVGITLSKEQLEMGKETCKGLPVELRLQDYRTLQHEKFDHIVSLGMLEHVGYKNYKEFMQMVFNALRDDGIFLVQTIGGNRSTHTTDPWLHKYIFPNSMLPSIRQIAKAIEGKFVMEDWHSFGTHYDKTLMAWFQNFDKHWDTLKEKYGERFYRMWKYYLLSCAGAFRARKTQLWQIVLSKKGLREGFRDVRHSLNV